VGACLPALPPAEAAGVNPVQLKADNVYLQAFPETWFYSRIYVLSNDIPSGKLRTVGVEIDPAGWARGAMSVDRSGAFLNYALNTKNMWSGLSFTDTFKCAPCFGHPVTMIYG
jgi:hypothetical protein